MNGSTKGRQPWKYQKEAREYHRKTGYAAYTMAFNAAMEAKMMNPSLAKEWRILAAIELFSWGRFSDFAVDAMPALEATDPKPRPLTQEALGRILGLSPASMSEGCVFLKDQGYLRKDHPYLFLEKKANPLESAKDSGVNSDSTNSHSPYLRFKSSYLSENKDLSKIITEKAEERNKKQDEARHISTELRKLERVILAAFRDWEREHPQEEPQQNQQEQPDQQSTPLPLRLCACAQNELGVVVEHKANCTYSNVSESDSNSKMEYFATPEPPPLESELHSTKNPNKNDTRRPSSLKPLKSLNTIAHTESVSQSSQADRLTDRQRAIMDSIPAELLEEFHDTPSGILLDRIDNKLGPVPLQQFTESIRERRMEIFALGFLASVAADLLRDHNKRLRNAQESKPMKTEKRTAMEEARELIEAEYGS